MADIYNTANDTLLSGTSGADKVYNGGWWDKYHNGGSYVSIAAGAGSDTIENNSGNVSINGGALVTVAQT